jgi:hypothetical protein
MEQETGISLLRTADHPLSTGFGQPLAERKVGSKFLLRRKGFPQPTVDAVARTTPTSTPFAEVTRCQGGIERMSLSPLTKRDLTVEIGSSHPRNPPPTAPVPADNWLWV